MLHRAATLFIVLFWLTMTGLLVRNEVAPEGSGVREVPVGYVLQRLFLPEKIDLNITTDGTYLGTLRLRPHIDPETKARVLVFESNMQIKTGGTSRQRIGLKGRLQLDREMTLQQLNFALALSDPAPRKTEVTLEPAANRAHVQMSSQAKAATPWLLDYEHDYTLDQAGARELLEQMGFDPALLTNTNTAQLTPKMHARLSSLLIRGVPGDRVDTFLLTVEQSGQTLAEIHVSQLGTVLQAKILGYNLAPDEVIP